MGGTGTGSRVNLKFNLLGDVGLLQRKSQILDDGSLQFNVAVDESQTAFDLLALVGRRPVGAARHTRRLLLLLLQHSRHSRTLLLPLLLQTALDAMNKCNNNTKRSTTIQ